MALSNPAGVAPTGPARAAQQAAGSQKPAKDAKLLKAAQEFEAFFVAQMLKQMRQAIPSSDPLHSRGEDMFRDLLDDQVGRDVAQGQGVGLADTLYRQLSLDEGRSSR